MSSLVYALVAQLYQPAALRRPKQMGRPRKVGKRLPGLKALVNNPYTPWQTVETKDWYGQGDYPLHITSATAVWYKTGMPAVPIRWVLIKDPKGKFETQALLCTDLTVTPVQILQWFRWRWQVEVTFEEARAHLGVETRAAMVTAGYCAHHPCATRAVLNRDRRCPSAAKAASV
jgi:hypothetical protein